MHPYPCTQTAPTPDRPAPTAAPLLLVPREERAAAMAATVDAAFERLARQLAEGYSREFKEVLGFLAKFHKYSSANCLLILAQRPDASRVAGVKRWNELGYRIKPGERAVWIWCPVLRRELDAVTGEETEVLTGFRPGPVFAAEQLANVDEKPLPSPFPRLPDDANELYATIRSRVEAAGIRVEERALVGGVQGVSYGGRVVVRQNLDSRNRTFVLLHEVVHELAHHGPDTPARSAQWRELEAEAAAFAAASALGLDIPSSRDYILAQGIRPEDLRAALGEVQRLVRKVLAIVAPEEQVRRAA